MRRVLAVMATSLLLLSGCGTETAGRQPAPEARAPSPSPASGPDATALAALAAYTKGEGEDAERGDDLFHFVDEQGDVVDTPPWSACLGNGCWDGAPGLAGDLPEAGSPKALYFAFDYAGWDFRDVTFNPVEDACRQRVITVEATQVSDQVFRIDPAGEPGRWRVDVFGRGPEGDAVTSIIWDTRTGGTKGEPASGISAVLAGHDGTLDSYGVELSLSGLDRSYPDATATITITSATGRSVTLEPRLASSRCGRAGNLFFTAPDDEGRRATELGDGPFTYSASVRLGDTTYVGTGTYPQDLIRGNEPSIRLTWDPPLPSYAD